MAGVQRCCVHTAATRAPLPWLASQPGCAPVPAWRAQVKLMAALVLAGTSTEGLSKPGKLAAIAR